MLTSLCGLETEYGLSAANRSGNSQIENALDFLASCSLPGAVPWDLSLESPQVDARDRWDEVSSIPAASSLTDGFLLPNGARFYVDHGHPEYCTPECRLPADVVASDIAGELLLDRCRAAFDEREGGGGLSLFKNNSDHKGNAYGCHENYLVTRQLYEDLFLTGSKTLLGCLVPFLVSRIVICGSGKVGGEHGLTDTDYQISQRADFIETLMGLQTTHRRPLVNTRDEPHADRSRHRRLHVIPGDANMAETSTYLKVGCLQVLLAMLEEGVLPPVQALRNPLAALREFSRDPYCRTEVELEDGVWRTAIGIQTEIAAAAEKYVSRNYVPGWMRDVVARWILVLTALRRDRLELRDTLDWVIKLHFIDEWRRKRDLPWDDPRLVELEIRYHDIDRQRSLYHLLLRAGRVRRVVTDAAVAAAATEPPPGTRACIRANAVKNFGATSATWAQIRTVSGEIYCFPEDSGLCDS